ncbi:MAG: alternate F1F0 ATPase, F1 subunit alpha [Planctomycetaceae bacterium]
MTQASPPTLQAALQDTFEVLEEVRSVQRPQLEAVEVGVVVSVGPGTARVRGLPDVQSEELLEFPRQTMGMAFNLDEDEIGVVLLDRGERISAGDDVRRTGRVMDVPVGNELLGRVIDPLGRPLDEQGPLGASIRWPCERDAPGIMQRLPVTVPLQTGIKVIDALVPVGRGQRELILGDRQTGKTAIAIDTMLNQRDVICVYCAIGQRTSAVAKVIDDLRQHDVLKNCVIAVSHGNDPPGVQYVAPYAATSIAEYFMSAGRDVLIVYDDLTAHARAYRELSLLLRRPPGREAFPGDIFYVHSRLLERATHLRDEFGGGSLTALPIAETEAQNVAAYIPTNLISITDGQILLSPGLFQKGNLPAVDVGRSVSRVGGKTQLPAYRAVASDLKLSYAQFEELEAFSRFSSRLDEETQSRLDRGRLVREVFKQQQADGLSVPEQIAVLLAATTGVWDRLPLERVAEAETLLRRRVSEECPDVCGRIVSGERLSDEDRKRVADLAAEVAKGFVHENT